MSHHICSVKEFDLNGIKEFLVKIENNKRTNHSLGDFSITNNNIIFPSFLQWTQNCKTILLLTYSNVIIFILQIGLFFSNCLKIIYLKQKKA